LHHPPIFDPIPIITISAISWKRHQQRAMLGQISNYNSPPAILPLKDSVSRPLWSVMIPAYNCYNTLSETIRSVLMQDLGKDQMQIEVVDDGSSDGNVKELVEQLGKGRIEYFRKEHNEGSLANFETCINRARGKLIHLLHGDDKVRNGYYNKIGELFEKHPNVGAAFCRYTTIDNSGKVLWDHGKEMNEDGVLNDWLYKIGSRQRLQYCTISVKREVYEKLGGFYGVTYGEDWEMWVRIAAHYDVAYTPQILAEYRVHNNSISYRSYINAKHVEDMNWVVNSIQKWLPEEHRKDIRNQSLKHYALYAMDVANGIWHQTGNRMITHKLMIGTAGMYFNKEILSKMMKIYIKMLINRR
jgi:glycosyltransferase involved in cell wall biosynthesis